jgi:hypothetical protein
MSEEIVRLARAENISDVSELTQKAIEEGLIETVLSDPEEEVKLALRETGEGQFAKAQEELETIKHYVGYAGEHLVVSELLLLGINAMRPNVDDGWDVIAIDRNQKTFFIQVKTAHQNKYDRYSFHLGQNDFSDSEKIKNRVFVFVFLSEEGKEFAIMSGADVQVQVDKGNIWKISSTKRLRFRFYLREGKLFLGNLDNGADRFLNNWKVFGIEGRDVEVNDKKEKGTVVA